MGLLQKLRGLFGAGKAEKQAQASEKRDSDQKKDDDFRKALRG